MELSHAGQVFSDQAIKGNKRIQSQNGISPAEESSEGAVARDGIGSRGLLELRVDLSAPRLDAGAADIRS